MARKGGISWEFKLGVLLLLTSALLLLLHYAIFKDLKDVGFYLLMDLGFIPIEVLLVSLVIHRLLNMREKQERLEKMNMVIGVFFSEMGGKLLEMLSDYDPGIDKVRELLIVRDTWMDAEFEAVADKLNVTEWRVDQSKVGFEELRTFLLYKRDLMLRLSENPNLLEHESFTDLLRATFHLTEELENRTDVWGLPPKDKEHLINDINRVYALIGGEWLGYMRHLRNNYPHMFSLAMRTNPFDKKASAVIWE
jgi:hypothetical protein